MTRTALGWADLPRACADGGRVGVWGLGREGQASLRKLRALGIEPVLVDDNPAADGVLKTADGGLGALERCAVVIKTPGISPYGPEAARLRAAGVTLAGGLGLWANEADLSRVVYVTGTKGKSTTSSVIGHLLRGLGRTALVGGNFGAAPYDPQQAGDYDYWVIEVSSYTATDLAVTPPVTAVTSLHPDHLPWHGDVERYYGDKLSATAQPGAALTVANGDSELLRARSGQLGPRIEWVSETDSPGATWMDHLGLPGRHNRRNALIARAVLRALGVGRGRCGPGPRRGGRRGAGGRRGGLHPAPQPPHPGRHGRRCHVHRRLAVHQRAAHPGRARLLSRPPGGADRRRPGPRNRLRAPRPGRDRPRSAHARAHPARQRPPDQRVLRRRGLGRARPHGDTPRDCLPSPTARTWRARSRSASNGPGRTASCCSRRPPRASATSATTATGATSSPPPCAPSPADLPAAPSRRFPLLGERRARRAP